MSKTNGLTKTATLISYLADCEEERVDCGDSLRAAHEIGGGNVVAWTTSGPANWISTFNAALPGDRVVLRRATKASPWVMTGHA